MPKRKNLSLFIAEEPAEPTKKICTMTSLKGMQSALIVPGANDSLLLSLPRELLFCLVDWVTAPNVYMVTTLRRCCKTLCAVVDSTIHLETSVPLLLAVRREAPEAIHYLWPRTDALAIDSLRLAEEIVGDRLCASPTLFALSAHIDSKVWASVLFDERQVRGTEQDYCRLFEEGIFGGETEVLSEALAMACAKNWKNLVNILLILGADPAYRNQRPLRNACRFADLAIVETLLAIPEVDPRVNSYSPFRLVSRRFVGTDLCLLTALTKRLPHCRVKASSAALATIAQKYDILDMMHVFVQCTLNNEHIDPFASGLWNAVSRCRTGMMLFLQHERICSRKPYWEEATKRLAETPFFIETFSSITAQ